MHAQFFTDAERTVLRANPYIAAVTEKTIRFKEEFAGIFVERLNNGESPKDAFRNLGIDPAILGETRMRGMVHKLVRQHKEQCEPAQLQAAVT